MSFLEVASRRIAERNFSTLNNDFWGQYVRHANTVFDKTGYDLSRFEALGSEKQSMGENYTHSQGSGVVHKIGQITEDVIFKNLHGNIYERFAALTLCRFSKLKDNSHCQSGGINRTSGERSGISHIKRCSID